MSEENPSTGVENNSDDLDIKLIIYDFDQTITNEHLYHKLNGGQEDELNKLSDEQLLEIFGGKERVQRLKQHFERIHTTSCELLILSFNYKSVIQNALQRMGLLPFFDPNTSIVGRGSELLTNTANQLKSECISKLKSNKQLNNRQILFIDDDNTNIEQCKSLCVSILINEQNGMSDTHMRDIELKCGITIGDELKSAESPQKNDESEQISKNWIYACAVMEEWAKNNTQCIPKDTTQWEEVIKSEIIHKLQPAFNGKNDIEQLAIKAKEIDVSKFNNNNNNNDNDEKHEQKQHEQKHHDSEEKVQQNMDDRMSVHSRVSSSTTYVNYQILDVPVVSIRTHGPVSDDMPRGSIIGIPINNINNENELIQLFKNINIVCERDMQIFITKGYFMFLENWQNLKTMNKHVNENTLFLYIRFRSHNDNATFHLLKEAYKQQLGFNIIEAIKKPSKRNKNKTLSRPYNYKLSLSLPPMDHILDKRYYQNPQCVFNEIGIYDAMINDAFDSSFINHIQPQNYGNNNMKNVNNNYNKSNNENNIPIQNGVNVPKQSGNNNNNNNNNNKNNNNEISYNGWKIKDICYRKKSDEKFQIKCIDFKTNPPSVIVQPLLNPEREIATEFNLISKIPPKKEVNEHKRDDNNNVNNNVKVYNGYNNNNNNNNNGPIIQNVNDNGCNERFNKFAENAKKHLQDATEFIKKIQQQINDQTKENKMLKQRLSKYEQI